MKKLGFIVTVALALLVTPFLAQATEIDPSIIDTGSVATEGSVAIEDGVATEVSVPTEAEAVIVIPADGIAEDIAAEDSAADISSDIAETSTEDSAAEDAAAEETISDDGLPDVSDPGEVIDPGDLDPGGVPGESAEDAEGDDPAYVPLPSALLLLGSGLLGLAAYGRRKLR